MKRILRTLIWPIWWLTRDYYEAKAEYDRAKRSAVLIDKLIKLTSAPVGEFTAKPPRFIDHCPLTKWIRQ